jgi:hypothetical protein
MRQHLCSQMIVDLMSDRFVGLKEISMFMIQATTS